MKRILVGIDGSEAAGRALHLAWEIARRFEARLSLVMVVPPMLLPNDAYAAGVVGIEKEHRKHAESVLRQALASLDAPPGTAESVLLFGAPAESLAEQAFDPEVGMVVVGSRGRSTVARALLGSVSDRLAHVCQKPVLIVH